jgi:hypothetical protein
MQSSNGGIIYIYIERESSIWSSIGGIIYIYILGGFSERKATPERLEEIVKKVVKQVHRLDKENLDY